MTSKTLPLVLAGFGNVGKAFFNLLKEKSSFLEFKYRLRLVLKGILELGGGLLAPANSCLVEADLGDASGQELSCHPLWRPGLDFSAAVQALSPGVLVLATPSSLKTGEPGLSLARLALSSGWHVVTADKAPLVIDFAGLSAEAQRYGLGLKYSGATAAALPALDVGLYCLAGAEVVAIEGILNGTTNFILTQMEKGRGYEESLAEARARGIAEPDPSRDVEGWDTAIKLLLIARTVMEADLRLEDIAVEGITGVSPEWVARIRRQGSSVKLLGRAEREQGKIKATVQPRAIDQCHPLFGVDETNKAVTFLTDTMGSITVSGGKSDPRGAAAALLKDIVHLFFSF